MGFGIKTKELNGSRIQNGLCSQCGAEAVYNAGSIKLLHFWGIPLVPIYASTKVRCANCGSLVKLKQATAEAKANASSLITPLTLIKSAWGLAVAVVAIAGLLTLGFISKEQEQKDLAAPMPGDVYIIKMASFVPDYQQTTYPYGVLKISSVEGSKVHFLIGKQAYGNMKSARKSLSSDGKNSDFYSDESLDADLATLKAQYESGAIKDIRR